MRTLIGQKRRTGREVTEWLTVIDEFDQLVTDRAPLERLVEAAVAAHRTGAPASSMPSTGASASASPASRRDWSIRPSDEARVIAVLTSTRLRGRETGIVGVDDAEVVAASVDDAGGRIGLCWLAAGDAPWRPLDELVAQRLSSGAAINSVRLRDERATHSRLDYAALEQLLSGAARRTRPPPRPCVAPDFGQDVRWWPLRRGRSPAATSAPRPWRRRSPGRWSRRGCLPARP